MTITKINFISITSKTDMFCRWHIDKTTIHSSEIEENSLDSFVENLQAVSFSGNHISVFPFKPLRRAVKLSHLNLGKYTFKPW